MSFLQPTYLWGLFSLLVPLVIHLLNKGDVKTIKVGSVRYLTEQETKQTRQLKLNDLLLLFMRMLLLGLLVFAMAEPIFDSQKKNVPLTYLIEPSLINSGQMDAFLKETQGVPIRFFSKDFPSMDSDDLPEEVPTYWQLAQELQNLESDSIVVFSKARISGIQGIRPLIPATVFWIVKDEVAITDSLVGATATKDGAVIHTLKSDESFADIHNEFISKAQINYSSEDSISIEQNGVLKSIPLRLQDTLRIGMYYDIDFLKEKVLLSAAFKALADYSQNYVVLEEIAETDSLPETFFDLSVWLKSSPPSKIDGKLLQYQADSLATNSIEKVSEKDVFYLTERLTIETILNERLSAELLEIVALRPQLEEAMRTLDKRTLPEEEFLPASKDFVSTGGIKQQQSMVNRFWIAAILVLVMERLLAKFRKQ